MSTFINFHRFFGLAGVAKIESSRMRRIGYYFECLMLLVAFVLVLQWHFELERQLTTVQSYWINFSVWLFFVIQTGVLTLLARDKRRYLRANWASVCFIALGLLIVSNYAPVMQLLGQLRLILVLWLLMPWLDVCRHNFADNRPATTIITAVVMVVMAGVVISGIDPAISNPVDGIWWAWVTATTVGYGDVVPVSIIGRIFAAVLILMGLAVFSAFTANFSAMFIRRAVRESLMQVKQEGEDIRKILRQLQQVKREEDDILQLMRQIDTRLKQLQQGLNK